MSLHKHACRLQQGWPTSREIDKSTAIDVIIDGLFAIKLKPIVNKQGSNIIKTGKFRK